MSNYHSFLPNFNDQDVLAFCPVELEKSRKPEMIKYVRLREIFEKVFFSKDKMEKFEQIINSELSSNKIDPITTYNDLAGNQNKQYWFGSGVDCEILNLGDRTWKKGKIRLKVTLEFCQEVTESSATSSALDSIRQISMNHEV